MKNSWLIWFLIVGVVVTVLVAFNYQGSKQAVPLSEIFPDETYPVEIEYEFVDSDEQPAAEGSATQTEQTTKVAAMEAKTEAVEATPEKAEPIAETAKAEPASTPSDYNYTIQVASFKTKDRADKAMQELIEKEYPAFVVSKNLGDKGTWFRVYVGNFDAKDKAEAFLVDFKQRYESSFIISSKKN